MAEAAGPGAIQDNDVDIRPRLEGAGPYEYVTILNPLPVDFYIRVAQDIPTDLPQEIRLKTGGVRNESDLLRTYGDTFKNPDFQAKRHITNDTVIKAGQTINLKGNDAQVAVRQLVAEIAQRSGKSRMLADPTVRQEIEDQIIKGRGSVQELLDRSLQSPTAQIDEAINRSNEVADENNAFPGLAEEDPPAGTGVSYTPNLNKEKSERVGRKKKTDS